MAKINFTVNGKTVEIEEGSTLTDFIREKKVTGTMFAIEKNLEIINKDCYDKEVIKSGDVIELVGIVGGG